MFTGPNIVRDGLVFGYDTGYGVADNNTATRFYPGKPTTNLVSIPYLTNIPDTTVGNASIIKQDFGNGRVGLRFTQFETANIVSFAPSVSSFTPIGGGTYTFSADVRSTKTDKTLKNQLWVYVNGVRHWLTDSLTWSTSVTENGVLLRASNATDTWERHSVSFTFPSGTLTSFGISGFYRRTSNFVTDVANLQLEANSNNTPFLTGTRSSTQSLIDLTKTTNIDISNVSFDSTGQPTFDGTDDRISIPAGSFPTIGVNDFTVEVICKNTKTSSYNHFFSVKDQSHFALKMENAGNRRAYVYRTSGTSTYSAVPTYLTSTSNYYHLLVKREGDNLEMFLNGVSTGTKSGWNNLSIDNNTHTSYIGWGWASEYTGGDIPIVKIYNRALTAQEVKQNYRAYKNRFDI